MRRIPKVYTDDRGVEYILGAANLPLPQGWALCLTCYRAWNDAKSTSVTPAPSGRCPFEWEHEDEEYERLRRTDSNDLTGEEQHPLVGKTIAEVRTTTVESAWGDEPATLLVFTDGTEHTFVHPSEEE